MRLAMMMSMSQIGGVPFYDHSGQVRRLETATRGRKFEVFLVCRIYDFS